MAAGRREVIRHCRLAREEAGRLKEQARERGMTESAYIRLLLSGEPEDYPEIRILLKELVREVNAIGNNINQITRNYNSGLYRQEDKEFLRACMRKLCLLVRETEDRLGGSPWEKRQR